MEEKKKSNKGLIVFVIILIIIIIGLVGYIAVDKGIIKLTAEKVEEKNNKSEAKEEKEEPTEEENSEVSEANAIKCYTDDLFAAVGSGAGQQRRAPVGIFQYISLD